MPIDYFNFNFLSLVLNSGPPNIIITPQSFHQLHIQWDASTNPDVLAYVVFYRERALSGEQYMSIGTVNSFGLISDLRAGTEYSFRVLAYTVNGNGAGSDLVHGTTLESCKILSISKI